jgi:RNA-directed DNA polymerase
VTNRSPKGKRKTKTKIVRPMKSNFLGFTYIKMNDKWECMPTHKSKMSLYNKC